MSLLKNNFKFLFVPFLILSNYWIYRIVNLNLTLGLIVAVLSLIIIIKSRNTKVLIICTIVLLVFQFQTTNIKSLTLLDNDQQRVQQERIRSYPLIYINLFSKVIWIYPEKWIEQNNFVITFSKVEKNLFDNLDINQYFFGGFPRNNTTDFEKFPFIFLPLFTIGLYAILKEKKYSDLLILFLIPVFLLSFIGNDNQFGPFVLFPFFILMFFEGSNFLFRKIKNV